MIITLDKSKGTRVGNDNRDVSCVVSVILQHVLNLIKQTPFLVYFASFFWSYISTSDLKGMLICLCDFGKYAAVQGDSIVAMVTNHALLTLVQRCLHQDPQDRPSMEDIIGELEKLV